MHLNSFVFVAAYSLCALSLCVGACATVATFNPPNPIAMQDSWQVTPTDPTKTLVLIANPEQTCDDSYAMLASGPGATITVTQSDELIRFRGDKYYICIDGEIVCSKDRPQPFEAFTSALLWRSPTWGDEIPIISSQAAVRTTPFALVVRIDTVWDTFTATYQVDFSLSDHRLCTSQYAIQLSGTYTAFSGVGAFFNLPTRNFDLVNLCIRVRLAGVTHADWYPVSQLYGRSTGQVTTTAAQVSLGNSRESPDRWAVESANSRGTLRFDELVTVYIPNHIQALSIYDYALDTGADVCSQLLTGSFQGSSLTYYNSTHYFASATISRPYGSPGGGRAALCGNFGTEQPWTLLSEILSDEPFLFCEAHGGVFQSDLNTCLYCSLDETSEPCHGHGQCILNRENKTELLLETPSCTCDEGFYGEYCQYAILPTPSFSLPNGTYISSSLMLTVSSDFSVEVDLPPPLSDLNCSSPCSLTLSTTTVIGARSIASNGSSSSWVFGSFILNFPTTTTSTPVSSTSSPTTLPEIDSTETSVQIGSIWNVRIRYASSVEANCARLANGTNERFVANSSWISIRLVMPARFAVDWCSEVKVKACHTSCTELKLPMTTSLQEPPGLSPKIGTWIGESTLSQIVDYKRLLLGPLVLQVTDNTVSIPADVVCDPNTEPVALIRAINSEEDAIFAMNSFSGRELAKASCPTNGLISAQSFWLMPTPEIRKVTDVFATEFQIGIQDEGNFSLEAQQLSSRENASVMVQPQSCTCTFDSCLCRPATSIVALSIFFNTVQHQISTTWQWLAVQAPTISIEATIANTSITTHVNTTARRTVVSWTAFESPIPIEFEGNCSQSGQSCRYESESPHNIPTIAVKAPKWYTGVLYFQVAASQNNQTVRKLVHLFVNNSQESARNAADSVAAIFDSTDKDCSTADISMSVVLGVLGLFFILQACINLFSTRKKISPSLKGTRAILRTHKWVSWMAPCSLRCGCFHTINLLRSLSLAWFLLSSEKVVDIFSTVHPVVGPTLLYVILEGVFRIIFHVMVPFGHQESKESDSQPKPPSLDIEVLDLQPEKLSLDALEDFNPNGEEKIKESSQNRAVPWLSAGVSFVVFVVSWTLALVYGSCTLISPWLPTLILCDIFILETIFVLLTCLYRWQTNSLSENMAHWL